ncbi:hypothetical protein KFU94_24575 [Chloroflexi bacterium TSY]|nr:hypothetical protein [Chloroflexi bacterium TSY]
MLYTYEYDSSHLPAMPVIDIQIGRVRSNPELSFTALVDSGADATLIPLHILDQVRARRGEEITIRGITGLYSVSYLYFVSLQNL